MSRKTITSSLAAAVIAALGIATAFLSFPSTANAYDITALPAPYTVSSYYNVAAQNGECQTFYVVHWYDQSVTLGYGAPVNTPNFTDCNPQFQYRLDEFVDATINLTPPVTTTVPPVTTTDTTPAPPPTTTDAQPPAAPTTTAPAPVDTTATTTTAVDTTTGVSIQAQIDTLTAQLTALSSRVDAIANANQASWSAFIAALQAGASATDAALAARSAGLNAIYQL